MLEEFFILWIKNNIILGFGLVGLFLIVFVLIFLIDLEMVFFKDREVVRDNSFFFLIFDIKLFLLFFGFMEIFIFEDDVIVFFLIEFFECEGLEGFVL